jgi:DNA-directed RNA polymerase specialized sigma24 family protein
VSHTDFPALFEKMAPDEQARLLARLTLACESLLRAHGPKARHYNLTGEDLADETLMRAWSQRRRCPKDLSPYVFLVNTAKSILSHEAARPEHKKQRVTIDDDPKGLAQTLASNDDVDATATANITLKKFKAKLGDEELESYVDDLIKYEGSSAKALAAKTGKPVPSLDRRLSRRRSLW